MKKKIALMLLMLLGACTYVFAQDDDAWHYRATSVRFGKGTESIANDKDSVKWGEWTSCNKSVTITLDKNSITVKDGDSIEHFINEFKVIKVETDSNPAHLLFAGFDDAWVALAAGDWYLYKGQPSLLYLFYENDTAIQYSMIKL